MSYVVFDYVCPTCARRDDNKMVRRSEMDEQYCGTNCDGDHPTKLVRLPAGTRTTFRFADGSLKK